LNGLVPGLGPVRLAAFKLTLFGSITAAWYASNCQTPKPEIVAGLFSLQAFSCSPGLHVHTLLSLQALSKGPQLSYFMA